MVMECAGMELDATGECDLLSSVWTVESSWNCDVS